MHWDWIHRRLSVLACTICTFALHGCGGKIRIPQPVPTIAHMEITNHVGGTHTRVIVHDGRWIQAFSNSIQIVDPKSLAVIHDVPLGEFGRCGPVVDMALAGDRLYAVIEDDAVVELAVPTGLTPQVERTISSEELGILPRRLSVVDESVYVSGVRGVVTPDGQSVFKTDGDCGRVARAADGLVVCVGRRVHRVIDQRYLGAASELLNVPANLGANTPATLLFALQGEESALLGLMTGDIRELPGGKGTTAMPVVVRRIRTLGDDVFVVGSERIDRYRIAGESFQPTASISIRGALDIDKLDDHTFAIVGTSGRAVYQFGAEGAAGQFTAAEREASRLTLATTDGLNILAGGLEGAWMYLVNARADLTRKTIDSAPPAPRIVATIEARAEISPDNMTLSVTPIGPPTMTAWQYREEKGARLHTVTVVYGDFWVGHDRGITILRADGGQVVLEPEEAKSQKKPAQPAQPVQPVPAFDPVIDRVRIPGPVRYLFPLLAGRGASYVSEFGGFGVARFIDEPDPNAVVEDD